MIIPNKNIRLQNSFLGMGTVILGILSNPQTVSSLWEKVKIDSEINSFDKYVLTLDFLYMLGLLEINDGIIRKVAL